MMDYINGYDETDPLSIEQYSQGMVGKTFREIWEEDDKNDPMFVREISYYGSSDVDVEKRNKGNLGEIIEEKYFHYECNGDSRPDFHEAGVELKVTPFKKNRDGSLSAKERLILTMIDYFQIVNEDFEHSHLWNKAKLILLVYYLYSKDIRYNLDYTIWYSKLYTPPEQDVLIIKHDYELIVAKVRDGRAHELSEGDTLYLGAATKSSSSKTRREQPFSRTPAKPRAFSFKQSYMTYVLNNFIVPGKTTYEPVIKDKAVASFEDYVVGKIQEHQGESVEYLCKLYDIRFKAGKKPKSLEALIAYRILGIKGNHAQEFVKAGVVIKTIRILSSNKIKESMSFPAFRFKELAQESWEDSSFANYLRETRFLFVVYKYDEDGILRLRGCQFWNIPYEDLEIEVKSVWAKAQETINNGLKIEMIRGTRRNNFPKASENRVCHVRPHARNVEDTDELPDGRKFPKQSFWLNNTYIYDQINDNLKF